MTVSESDKGAKSLAAVIAAADLNTLRTRLAALGVAPAAQPGTPGAHVAQDGHKKRTRGKRRPPAAAFPR